VIDQLRLPAQEIYRPSYREDSPQSSSLAMGSTDNVLGSLIAARDVNYKN